MEFGVHRIGPAVAEGEPGAHPSGQVGRGEQGAFDLRPGLFGAAQRQRVERADHDLIGHSARPHGSHHIHPDVGRAGVERFELDVHQQLAVTEVQDLFEGREGRAGELRAEILPASRSRSSAKV